MKTMFFSLVFTFSCFFANAQKQDSTRSTREPLLLIPTFFETTTFLPGAGNSFEMTQKISAGGMALIGRKKIVLIGGGRFWMNTAGSYFLTSRSWAQNGFHGAFGCLWKQKLSKNNIFYFGPVVSRTSYIVGGMPPGPDNIRYQLLKREVESKVPWIRGLYWNSPYLFVRWDRYKEHRKIFELEGNLLIPGKYPSVIVSWQPNTLVTIARLKVLGEVGKLSLKGDLQIPALQKAENLGGSYSDICLKESTFKLEGGYSVRMSGGKVKFVGGYERDWHALNYPSLLFDSDDKKVKGSWGAFYLGVRLESFMMK